MIRYLLGGLLLMTLLTGCNNRDWRTASRESAGIAPDPQSTSEAIVQVYGAKAWGWRGWFAIHTWVATKENAADNYTVYEVIGWRLNRGMSVLRIANDLPDRHWFGEKPELLAEHRGEEAEMLIAAVDQAARDYPWQNEYRVFPGPNSNTFTAWIAKQVPELDLKLPFRAIGSGYLN
ncbi:Protein of unknown function [Malonomonas rubra DSM 5091]|uniref:DUF3750 domain-containing protein n=1 Tax=Malonomonas rubra DSM 5091 TaxID=1122189 RepID=A0A1M6N371_MALRU|nr:DUF3750 domain-containing protein [Malonomonas rubra]SHJ90189.1 Protein of unknown function [Malonomonas rubra DSM 5091]